MQRIDWGTYYNKLFVAGLGGRAPELFILHTSSMRRFSDAGFLRPIDDLLTDFPTGDLAPNVWAAAKFHGRHMGLPLDVHPMGLYYNRALFEKAGIAAPPVNQAQFRDAAERVVCLPTNGSSADKLWGFAFSDSSHSVFTVMCQFGGKFFTASGEKCVINNPENIAALQFCYDLIQRQKVAPPLAGFDPWVGFRQGRVGMTWNGIYMLPDLQKQQDLNFAGAPVASLGVVPAAWANSHNFCFKAKMEPKTLEAAWRFAHFYSDHSLDWAEAGQVPVRRSLRESARFKAMTVQSQFAREIQEVVYTPQLPFVFEFQTEFDYAVERTLRGSVAPEQALTEAETRINTVIARFQGNYPAEVPTA